ncbi:MAG: hypothetical protein MJ252_24480 [archaeon]|nr:hypothetical protein [archaeon]
MSKLNAHNLDVQRMLNVLKETYAKILICSVFTYDQMNDNIEKLKQNIKNEELIKDLEEHQEKVIAFHDIHLINPEDQKEEDKGSVEDESYQDEEGLAKEKEKADRDVKDLNGLQRDAPEVVDLEKSIRNFCRKWYHNKQLLDEIKKLKREDEKIENFLVGFEKTFNTHYEKFLQMTEEEHLSESNLNIELKNKINNLEDQIRDRTKKLQSLKKERADYKEKCNQEISKIKKDIEDKKINTKNALDELTKQKNEELNKLKEENDEKTKGLREALAKAIQEKTMKDQSDLKEESVAKGAYAKAKQIYSRAVGDYDIKMAQLKATFIQRTQEKEKNEIDYKDQKMEFDAVENKYNVLKENFLLTQQKCKDATYAEEVRQKAVEWMQGQFRGFMTRKQLRKKYKFLNVLRAPKKIDPESDPKKGKKGKTGK